MNEVDFQNKFQEHRLSKERIEKEGLMPTVKEKLRELVELCDSLSRKGTEEDGQLQSVLPMVYTLLTENRLDDLYSAIVLCFPEYYSLPTNDDTMLEWGGKIFALKQALEDGRILKTLFGK